MTQALWAFGGACGSIIGGLFGAKFGRKNTLLTNNIFIVSGIILQVVLTFKYFIKVSLAKISNIFQFIAFQVDALSYDLILVGRFLNGIGCGIGMTISPIFLTELAPLRLRGAFGTSYSLL